MKHKDDFDNIYKKYQPPIYRYCFEQLYHDEESAYDACSDVFLAFSRKQKFISEDKIEAWLYSAANKSILAVKRKYSRKNKNKITVPFDEKYDFPVDLYYDISLSVEEIYEVNLKIMDKLDEDMKPLFKYRFIEKRTLQEIQKITGMPYTTTYIKIDQVKKIGIKLLKEITDEMPY